MGLDLQEPRLSRMVALCLRAGKARVLAITAVMIAVISLADWSVGLAISLGVLYVLPMLLGAVALELPGIVGLAVLCAFLRSVFNNPPSPLEGALRFVFAVVAYIACGLFVTALVR